LDSGQLRRTIIIAEGAFTVGSGGLLHFVAEGVFFLLAFC
jgi:hypothetical protein